MVYDFCVPNIGQFLIDALLFQLTSSGISQIGDELDETAHIGVVGTRPAEEAGRCGRHGGFDGRSVLREVVGATRQDEVMKEDGS